MYAQIVPLTLGKSRYESACEAWTMGYLAGLRGESLSIRQREAMEYAPRLTRVYNAGVRAGYKTHSTTLKRF